MIKLAKEFEISDLSPDHISNNNQHSFSGTKVKHESNMVSESFKNNPLGKSRTNRIGRTNKATFTKGNLDKNNKEMINQLNEDFNKRLQMEQSEAMFDQKESLPTNCFFAAAKRCLDNKHYYNICISLAVSFYIIDFVFLLLNTTTYDYIFDIIKVLATCLFLTDIIFNWLYFLEFRWSFFFFIDVLTSTSLLFDTILANNTISDIISKSYYDGNNEILKDAYRIFVSHKFFTVMNTAKLCRIFKIYKLYFDKHNLNRKIQEQLYQIKLNIRTHAKDFSQKYDMIQNRINEGTPVKIDMSENRPSFMQGSETLKLSQSAGKIPTEIKIREYRVVSEMYNNISKILLIQFLVVACTYNFFKNEFWSGNIVKRENLDVVVNSMQKAVGGNNFEELRNKINSFYSKDFDLFILISDDQTALYANISNEITKYRLYELDSSISKNKKFLLFTEKRSIVIITIIFNALQCFVLCLSIIIANSYLTKLMKNMVLKPVIELIDLVNKISKDPLNDETIKYAKTHLISKGNLRRRNKNVQYLIKEETKFVMQAIVKISKLLAISFGEAGKNIIKRNLIESSFNALRQGQKVDCIFGFCDVRNFSEINSILQEDTIVFINRISEIVHSSVYQFNGVTNKNIGEAYLNIWKIDNETVYSKAELCSLFDGALMAYIKIIKQINSYLEIANYSLYFKDKIKDFKVNMGFGLHNGWAIEGAIGSECKIDASYLSANVNMASRLEAASRQYDVPILISGSFFKHLSKPMKNRCRFVDRVCVKGSSVPIDIYTVEMDIDIDFRKSFKLPKTVGEKKQDKQFKRLRYNQLSKNQGELVKYYLEKESYKEMLKMKLKSFYEYYFQGVAAYLKGNWWEAKEFLEDCIEIQYDGPAFNLLDYIRQRDFDAQKAKWNGLRILMSK